MLTDFELLQAAPKSIYSGLAPGLINNATRNSTKTACPSERIPPAHFDRVLAWGLIDNRPFLRCLHGYALCQWRLERWKEAKTVFERMLWLNPSDNQGVRVCLPKMRSREAWMDDGF
jgi:hypothetical protein